MTYFIYIFTNIFTPIFLIIILGFILDKMFNLNVQTLTKIQFYALIPALLFINIYNSQLEGELILMIMGISLSLFLIMHILSYCISKAFHFEKSVSNAFINSIILFNTGNYGIPLNTLLFNSPYALSIQIIIIVTQNILVNTVGIFNCNSGKGSHIMESLLSIAKKPMIYAIVLAFVLRGIKVEIPWPLMSSIDLLGEGLVPIALLTLGVQLSRTKLNLRIRKVYLSNFVRLLIGPIITYGLTILFGISGITARVLIIASAAPTAINSVLLAIEYDNEPDFASQTILLSTLFSGITVTTVIYLVTTFL